MSGSRNRMNLIINSQRMMMSTNNTISGRFRSDKPNMASIPKTLTEEQREELMHLDFASIERRVAEMNADNAKKSLLSTMKEVQDKIDRGEFDV